MRQIAIVLALGAALLAAPAAQAHTRLTPEQQLEKLLAGRKPGTPVNCINLTSADQSQIIDKTAIVYGTGRTIYVNRPTNVSSLNSDDILISNLHIDQQCNLDTIQLRDRNTRSYDGFVGLQQFVPYRRVASPQAQ